MGSAASVPDSLGSILQGLWHTAAQQGALEVVVKDMAKESDPKALGRRALRVPGQVQQLCCFILAALSGGEDEDLAVKRQRRRAVEAGALEALCQAALAHPHEADV